MNNFPSHLTKGEILFEKYKILKQIKKTEFLQIYLGKNIRTNESILIKIEPKGTKKKKGILETESYYLNLLKSSGIPIIKQIGYYNNNIISIQMNLGLSLSKIFDKFYHCFSIKDITMIAIQILERIKFIHSKNVIHSNINLDNLFIDFSLFNNVVYLTGFDHAIKCDNVNNNKHLMNNKHNLIFSSINSMKGNKINKKDDLESLSYILLYLLKGELPWEFIAHDLKLNEKNKKWKIYQLKKYFCLDLFCEEIPEEFKLFFNYVKELKIKEEIDYNYCFNLFYTIFKKNDIINDGIFSWYQEKRNNKNKIIKSYYKYLWQKKFLQKSTSCNNLIFENYIENDNEQNNLKKSNSCFLNIYNSNIFTKSKKITYNKNIITTNTKIKSEREKCSISLDEEKEYSIEGEIDNEEKLKTYKKKKAKKIIKRQLINDNLNPNKDELIYKTKNNSKIKTNNSISLKNENQLYTEYIIKHIPYIKIKKEPNVIKDKSKLINYTFKDINNINKNVKKKVSLNIKDLISNNNTKSKIINKLIKSENISVKKLANNTKELKIDKIIKVSKKKLNQTLKLDNQSNHKNIFVHNDTPIKQAIKRNIYSNISNKPENTISSYNHKINDFYRPKMKNMHSSKILKNNIIYPTSYNTSNDNSEYNIKPKKIKKNSFTIIHNSISKLNLIQNISNIYVTKSYFDEPKNVYIKPKNINVKKGKIKNMILKIKGNKSQEIYSSNFESKSEMENSHNYYYI